MADSEMDYQEALKVLTKMKNAAPAVAKTKLSGVIALLEQMHEQTQIATSKQSTVEAEKVDPAANESRLLNRLRLLKERGSVDPAPQRPPPGETVDYIFKDFDPEQFSIENMRMDIAPPPDTSELFADLPEFQPQREVNPRDFTLDAVLGIDQSESSPSDLLSVMGLDEEPKPAPDLFADLPRESHDDASLRELLESISPDTAPPAETTPDSPGRSGRELRTRSQLLKRIEAEEQPHEIGMEDVTGLLRGSEQMPEQPQGEWNVSDVLRDLGVERSSAAPPVPRPKRSLDEAGLFAAADAFERASTEQENAASLFDAESVKDTSEFDKLMGWDAEAPFGGTARLPSEDSLPEFGGTSLLNETDSPSQFGITARLPDLDEAQAPAWGATSRLGDADQTLVHDWDAELPPSAAWNSFDDAPAQAEDAGLNWDEELPPTDAWGTYADVTVDPAQDVTRFRPSDGTPHPDARTIQPPRFGVTDRLEQAAWNADYQPPPLDQVFDGGVSADGGIVPDEYAIYDADAVGGQEALDNLVAFAMGEAPGRGGEGDLPGATALLTNVREVLKPSLLLLRAQTELLRERVDAALDENDAEMVRLMHDNADMALTLLESLEMVMQLSENALDLNIRSFSALDLLRDAGERMQDRARLYRHRITVMLDRRLPPLRADYQRTLAILIDLMDNAVRYTPEGGSSRIAVDNLGGYVLFTVADNGIGLSDADMQYIGQPFWRALHQPLVRAHRGTGLRLYLARRVLEMQGGALFFSGEPNAGSTFSFTVPVAAGD
jgi:signal transduction histidine kinase